MPVTSPHDLLRAGQAIQQRLEGAQRLLEGARNSGRPADWEHLAPRQRVGAHELPEWYLSCFRTIVGSYGKDSAALKEWNEFLRAARDARPDLDLNDTLEVVRAGAEDLARALEVLQRISSHPPAHSRGRPTITVGR